MNSATYNISKLREENQNDAIKMYQQRVEQLKKRNDELKKKHNGLKEDFQYNYQLLRERDEELDKLDKEIEKKNEVILSLTKSIQNYKQQIQTEKSLKIKNDHLLNKSNEHIEIIKKENEIKLNDIKFEYSQKMESLEKQNTQQITQIQQLRELVQRLKSQNQTEKKSNQDLGKKYESKLDDLVEKLSNVQDDFEKEKQANKTRISEYIKTIQQKTEICINLEKNIKDLNENVSSKQCECNDLYFRLKERDKQINEIKSELNNSCSHNIKTENVLSVKDTKIQRLEQDLKKMYQMKYDINNEKNELNHKLIISNQEIEKLNEKIAIMSNQLMNTQQNKTNLINELTNENQTLKTQNAEIRNVTKDMKSAISQLHELSSIDKTNNGMDLYEMQSLIDENQKLKTQLNCVKSKLKEKERELLMIKKEKSRLHEISNRYHHQLTIKQFDEFPENDYYTDEDEENDDDENDTRNDLKTENDKLLQKIKALQTSLSTTNNPNNNSNHITKSRSNSLSSSLNSAPIPSRSKHSIRTKYDQVRRKLTSGMNDTKNKARSKHILVRNWNQR